MPKLIRNGAIEQDDWELNQTGVENAPQHQIHPLEQWKQLSDKQQSAVQLEPGDGIDDLVDHLDEIALVAISFPVFTDGRGFSYARELREKGYRGELRAVGSFIRDQMTYLGRVGFNAFQPADVEELEQSLSSLADFSESYQASVDQPLPLFRRR